MTALLLCPEQHRLSDAAPVCQFRMQDQLVVFMALAHGGSTIACGEPTLHTRTAMAVAEQLTPARFTVHPGDGNAGQPWLIECVGASMHC